MTFGDWATTRLGDLATGRSGELLTDSRTERGIRVAVIDSGVHAAHPHVGGVAHGFQVTVAGGIDGDFIDRLGHGTAVTAAIKEKAPLVDVIAIKVFDRELSATAAMLARAIVEAVERGADLINLSLGTSNETHRVTLEAAVKLASEANVPIVAAAPSPDAAWLPGALMDVVAVSVDWECPRDRYRVIKLADGRIGFAASGYPRPIPGVSPDRNLKGLSFAVANLTGFAALTLESRGRLGPQSLIAALAEINK